MDSKSIEQFLLSATSNTAGGVQGIGEGLAAMFGGMGGLPPGVDPKQMESMWKMLDQMAENDPEEYKKFIQQQMGEMKTEINKEKQQEEKAQTIQSEPAFSIRMLIARKVDASAKGKKKKDGGAEADIKLFDFAESQIKESFVDNDEKGDPLEEPKIYLNVVYHDNVMPPLNKGRDLADPRNDRDWLLIPIIFTDPKSRKNLEGKQIITYDGHVNACVIAKMRADQRAMRSISNFLIMKFQEHIEDEYIIHKKSIKFLNKKKYKCPKGSASQRCPPFVLPKEHDVRSFKQLRERLKKEHEEQEKKSMGGAAKQEIKMPTVAANSSVAQASSEKKEPTLEEINIPGHQKKQPEQKKVVIQEIGKTIPNYEMNQEGNTVTMTFNVEEEASAKDIDLDFSESQVILNSKNYEFKFDFKAKLGFFVDPESVKAKFNKAKKTLALTLTKKA